MERSTKVSSLDDKTRRLSLLIMGSTIRRVSASNSAKLYEMALFMNTLHEGNGQPPTQALVSVFTQVPNCDGSLAR